MSVGHGLKGFVQIIQQPGQWLDVFGELSKKIIPMHWNNRVRPYGPDSLLIEPLLIIFTLLTQTGACE
ncbi:hypothetical protein Q670_00400 [Alcanivorax sp. P2S70]|nr:hypothetical protein Q670_00400 [Alcanivorax sp. P2S70]